MAIKEVLELVGDDVVIKKLENVKKAGEDAFEFLNKGTPDLKFPEFKPPDSKPVQEFSGHITKLGDLLKILKPALSEAGASIGGLGTFGRLASTSLVGLGAALTGAVIVKLADLEETATKSTRALSDLFGSAAAGEAAFKGLETSAKALHTTTADLLPSIESLTRGLDKFAETQRGFKFVALKREDLPAGLSQGQEAVTKAVENFFKILRAGGLDTAKATEAQKAFFETMRQGGQLTAEALNKLPVGTVELLAQALGKGAVTAEQFVAEVAKTPINIDKVAKALAGFTTSAQKAFDDKAVRSYKDAFSDLLTFIEDGLKSATGKGFADFLTTQIDKFKDDLTAFFRDLKAAKDAFFAIPGPAIPGISAPAGPPTDVQKDLVNKFAQDSNTIKRQNQTTVDSVTADWAAFGSRFDAMTNQIVSNSKLWTDSIVEGSQKAAAALKAVTAPTPGAVPPGFLTPPAAGASPFAAPAATQESAQQATTTAQNAVAAFQAADDKIRLIWISLVDYIQTSFSGINLSGATQSLVQPFQDASTQIQPIIQQILQQVQQLMQAIQAASGAASQLGGRFSGFGGNIAGAPFAGGGMVRGPGSSTSDSIMAWLSNKEFVVNARAVDFYGSSLFAALNSMRLPRNITSGSANFAKGGQVDSAGSSLTLVLGGRQFEARASEGTVTALRRFAVNSQLASIGRKPGFVR